MTDEKIRIAIAEACGWVDIREWKNIVDGWSDVVAGKCPRMKCQQVIPDYPNDLNAMHEAEKCLVEYRDGMVWRNQLHEYEDTLWRVCAPIKNPGRESFFCFPVYATARQRAEAFLRTLGKWKD